MDTVQLRPKDQLALEFNKLLGSLVTKLQGKIRLETEMAAVTLLKNRIITLKRVMGDLSLISIAAPFFVKFGEQILDTDVAARDAFFMNIDVRAECATASGGKLDEFIVGLTQLVRKHYVASSPAEKAEIYASVKAMLTCCLEFELHKSN